MAGYLHRTATTAYPCYLPVLGEFSRSWSCKTCRGKNRDYVVLSSKLFHLFETDPSTTLLKKIFLIKNICETE